MGETTLPVGRRHVAVLDGIMSIVHKNAPGLLAEWKAAKRIVRNLPVESTEERAPVTPPAGS